jgi:exosortase
MAETLSTKGAVDRVAEREGVAPWLALGLVLLAGLFAYWGLTDYAPYPETAGHVEGAEEWFFAPTGGSPVLFFGVAAWMLFNRRRQIARAFGRPASWGLATLFLVPATGLYVWAHLVGAPDLTLLSMISMLLGIGVLLGGRDGLRAVWLPAVFLLLLVPWPAVLLNQVIYPLQVATARNTVGLLSVFGLPAAQAGDLILTPTRTFQVIETCTGLRGLETLMMSAIVYVELFYRSRRQAAVLVLVAPLLALLVNHLRVLSIVLNPFSGFAAVHTAQGILMLVVGVLLIAAVDGVLGRIWDDRPSGGPRGLPPRGPRESGREGLGRAAALGVLLLALGVLALRVPAWTVERPRQRPLSMFPTKLGEWTVVESLPLDRTWYGSVRFDEWVYRTYGLGSERVSVFLGADHRGERLGSLISEKTAVPASGYTLLERDAIRTEPGGASLDELLLRSRDGDVLVHRWYVGFESPVVEMLRGVAGIDRSPWRRPLRGRVVRLSTPVDDTPGGRQRAEERLRAFGALAREELARLDVPRETAGAPQVGVQG